MLEHSSNWHSAYPQFSRFWSAVSEDFAGGDAFLTALDTNWEVSDTCYTQEFWQGGTRLVIVYHFELMRGEEYMVMPVITTPYIRRIIRDQKFQLLPISERENKSTRNTADTK